MPAPPQILDARDERVRCAVMQPTYLPWLGYLDLMDSVDVWLNLDDVPFSRQSWQQRNRIKARDGLRWLTVPTRSKSRSGQLINEVEISEIKFVDRHRRSVRHAYSRAIHASEAEQLFDQVEREARSMRLLSVNLAGLAWLRERLHIDTTMTSTTSLDLRDGRIERLIHALQTVGANTYVTAPGAVEYLAPAQHIFRDAGITIEVHQYEHPVYEQLHPPFAPFASALDAILLYGPAARDVMLAGRRSSVLLGDLDDGRPIR